MGDAKDPREDQRDSDQGHKAPEPPTNSDPFPAPGGAGNRDRGDSSPNSDPPRPASDK